MRKGREAKIVRAPSVRSKLRQVTVETAISFALKLALVVTIPIEIHNGQYAIATGIFITLGVTMIPAILSRSLHINLPWEIDLIITLVIFSHAFLGYFIGLYQIVPFFDKMLHFGSTVMISILSFMIIYSFYYVGAVRLPYRFLFFFIVMTAVGLGGIWEIIEYGVDQVLGMEMQTGLRDTMFDLIFDTLGGIAAAVLGYLYIRYSKPLHQRRFAIPISRLFGIVAQK